MRRRVRGRAVLRPATRSSSRARRGRPPRSTTPTAPAARHARPARRESSPISAFSRTIRPAVAQAIARSRARPRPGADLGRRLDRRSRSCARRGGDGRPPGVLARRDQAGPAGGDGRDPPERGHSAAFVGLPGNPVAAFVTFARVVRPCCGGLPAPRRTGRAAAGAGRLGVLPTPPGPVSVRRRASPRHSSAHTRSISRSRPTSVVSGPGNHISAMSEPEAQSGPQLMTRRRGNRVSHGVQDDWRQNTRPGPC